ncbi:protein kinase PINOID 2-like [Cucurbita maxima]|uniref:non-specific serine/threonine protein kinase n=1 Tax=Cucurbita maxima TaxID=3661 RepID=A0A6J1KGU7_CUCMA|nr:protein kinase PINOID 2-like [Cucurbita maxima]
MAAIAKDESDYDSSCSSITLPDSTRSWMSNLSFGSQRRRSSSSATDGTSPVQKPHKANEVAWEAMRWLRGAKGEVGLENFRLLRRLGSGDIGNVYLCQIRKPTPTARVGQCCYAMKVVDREAVCVRNKERRAEMEKEILKMIDHPFLPTLYAAFEASHYSCLVMEFCPGGDLYAARLRQPAKRFSISSAKFYAAEIILALEYLHMMGIVYRDLKPENVLVRHDGHIMLSDFDLCLKCDVVPKLIRSRTTASDVTERYVRSYSTSSTTSCAAVPIKPVLSCFSIARRRKPTTVTTITEHADDDGYREEFDTEPELVAEPINARSKSFVGTHEYLAPEVISGQGHGSAVDWWTVGIFLYEMLYGKTPFKGENNEKTLMNILRQPLTFPRIGFSSSKEYEEMVKVEDLIKKLLVKNPKKRIGSLKGSIEIKRHEFFKGVNWALIRSVRPPHIPNSDHLNPRSKNPKLSKQQRQQPYQIPSDRFDYF